MKKYFKDLIVYCLIISPLSLSAQLDVDKELRYCEYQALKTSQNIPVGTTNIPRSISKGQTSWKYVDYRDWCSGFWPGVLWYAYESTGNKDLLTQAKKFTAELRPLSMQKAFDHDLGFQVFNSYGIGYRLTEDPEYRKILLRTADTLSTLFNPKVGTILSWPRAVPNMEWPQHNTIIDNMINLELLFWAAKNGGDHKLYDIASQHAMVTMKNHFRADFTAYHAVIYDRNTGKKIKGLTHQGYSDESMWARGQSWAIYGYTMCYRETRNRKFLDFAEKVADVYLKKLPEDLIPFWDFNDPNIPEAPRDASAAAIVASALLELSTLSKDQSKAKTYRKLAENMLSTLASPSYKSDGKNTALLLHSTGHKPNDSEIDASIIYADYYYIEALTRFKKLESNLSIYDNLKSPL